MICPACNYELSLQGECCENCGAPAYLAAALQAAEITHCTYCGAREETGKSGCPTCGLRKNFKTSEVVIGTCRNCGAAWRNTWLYCHPCGVARENGLVDSMVPRPASLMNGNQRQLDTVFADEEDGLALAYEPEWLSENEVVERMVERMFVDGNGSEPSTRRNNDLANFFRAEAPSKGIQSLPDAMPKATPPEALKASEARTPQPVVDDLPIAPKALAATANPPSQATISERTKTEVKAAPVTVSELPATNRTNRLEAKQAPAATAIKTTANVKHKTASAPAVSATGSAPVQAVKFIHKTRDGVAPAVDKGLIKTSVVLIGLILLFSALIVSGFRIRELFGRAQPQPQPTIEASPALTLSTEKAPPAPEGMVYVPGGSFRMGVEDGDSFEAPAHDVTVTPFFMDRAEVTNEQYAAFAKTTNHLAPPDWKSGNYPAGTAKFPVVQVSWQDANEYAAWAGKRLPTEAEWEFAARTNDGRRYPWGANWDANNANTSESKINHPVAVGSYAKAANPFGLLDLAGNVWEWTAGEVVSYKDPNITLAPGKVIRGGAFYAAQERATTTFRGFAPPDKQAAGIGFRCVKDVN